MSPSYARRYTRPLLRLLMGDGCLFDHATETPFERREVSGDTPRNFATAAQEFNAGDQLRHSCIPYGQMRTQDLTDNALDFQSSRRRQIKRAPNRHRFVGNFHIGRELLFFAVIQLFETAYKGSCDLLFEFYSGEITECVPTDRDNFLLYGVRNLRMQRILFFPQGLTPFEA